MSKEYSAKILNFVNLKQNIVISKLNKYDFYRASMLRGAWQLV